MLLDSRFDSWYIQIQHLLKLNKEIDDILNGDNAIQIQHLLKLNKR